MEMEMETENGTATVAPIARWQCTNRAESRYKLFPLGFHRCVNNGSHLSLAAGQGPSGLSGFCDIQLLRGSLHPVVSRSSQPISRRSIKIESLVNCLIKTRRRTIGIMASVPPCRRA